MAFQKFDEYMNAKGSIPKPKVKAVAGDVEGSTKQYAAAPDAENNLTTDKEGGKVSGKGKKKGGKYTAKNKMSENWGKENSELKWEPKTEFSKDTDKFIKSTKGMDMREFAQYVSDQHLIGEDVEDIPTISTPHGAFIPAPHELFRTTQFMIAANDKFMESFVREVKRGDGLSALISELAKHPELFSELATLLGEDEDFSAKLVRSIRLNEMVGGPMHKSMPDDLEAGEGDEGEEGEEDMDMGDEGGEEGEEDMDMDMDMDSDEEGDDMEMDGEEDMDDAHPAVPPALKNLRKAMGMY
jgi:hypothetical protein